MNRYVGRMTFVVLASVALAQGSAVAADPIRVTTPVQATKFDNAPARQYGAPDIAVDPENPLNMVATLPELPTKRCGLMRSTDGGVTWTRLDASPSPDSYPFCLMQGNSNVTQGLLAFGRNHTLYYALVGWDTQDGDTNGSVFVGRSRDFGNTWQTTTVRDNRPITDPREYDRPISGLAVDRRSGKEDVVAVSWRLNPVGLEAPNAAPILPMVAVSTDGAKTFPPAINLAAAAFEQESFRSGAMQSATTTTLPATPGTTAAPATTTTTALAGSLRAQPNQAANFGGSNPTVAVDAKGTIYAAWVSTYANISPSPQFAHFLSKSIDHGKTWTVSQISPFVPNNTNGYNAMHMVWTPKGGPEGSLNFIYDGSERPAIAGFTQVLLRRSTDGGRTWSDAKVLNDSDPAKLTYGGDPNISVAPNGRLDAAWWDTRNDPGIAANDVYYSSSSDGGATWSKNVRATDRLIDRKIGVYANNYDLAGPPGLTSTNAYAVLGWDDTRHGDAIVQTQDIYVGTVQYEPIATGSGTARYALAAVIGLLAVGLGFFIAAVMSRRRDAGRDMPLEPRMRERAVAERGGKGS